MKPDSICAGVDIETISRFNESKITSRTFLNLCFTPLEQQYCLSKAKPAQHFAARFAAKEAVIKALSGLDLYLERNKIEICNKEDGRPYLRFYTDNENILRLKTDISLSHSETSSIAFVIIYTNEK